MAVAASTSLYGKLQLRCLSQRFALLTPKPAKAVDTRQPSSSAAISECFPISILSSRRSRALTDRGRQRAGMLSSQSTGAW